jgi:hypothetical protein
MLPRGPKAPPFGINFRRVLDSREQEAVMPQF